MAEGDTDRVSVMSTSHLRLVFASPEHARAALKVRAALTEAVPCQSWARPPWPEAPWLIPWRGLPGWLRIAQTVVPLSSCRSATARGALGDARSRE